MFLWVTIGRVRTVLVLLTHDAILTLDHQPPCSCPVVPFFDPSVSLLHSLTGPWLPLCFLLLLMASAFCLLSTSSYLRSPAACLLLASSWFLIPAATVFPALRDWARFKCEVHTFYFFMSVLRLVFDFSTQGGIGPQLTELPIKVNVTLDGPINLQVELRAEDKGTR
jgi:hypothetical protein